HSRQLGIEKGSGPRNQHQHDRRLVQDRASTWRHWRQASGRGHGRISYVLRSARTSRCHRPRVTQTASYRPSIRTTGKQNHFRAQSLEATTLSKIETLQLANRCVTLTRMMRTISKSLLLIAALTFFTGCETTTITNLTPSTLPRDPSGQYLVQMQI